ncbi:MAG: hypothetical protein KAT28_04455 [Candidatus Aenigmarchaeota archaeon]|nr:hypothetical protein [Candidatus Aenigmarchaeota archaeon]
MGKKGSGRKFKWRPVEGKKVKYIPTKKNQRKSEENCSKAFDYLRSGDFRKAMKTVQEAIDSNPNNQECYWCRGNIYENLNELEKTKEDYLRIIKDLEGTIKLGIKLPDEMKELLGKVYNDLGLVYGKQKNPEKQKTCFESSLKYLDSPEANISLAAVYESKDNPEGALRYYKAYLKLKDSFDIEVRIAQINRELYLKKYQE